MFFKFSAINSENEKVESLIQAENKEEAEEKLRLRGYKDLEIKGTVRKVVTSKHVSSRDLAVMCRQISAILSSDMSILDGLLLVCEQTGNRTLEAAVSNVYDNIMGSGQMQLSDSMRTEKVFPSYMINLISIGEASGNLDDVFMQLAIYYEKDSRIKQKIKTAVTYPLLLTVLMIWVIGLLVVRILPMFENMLNSMGWRAAWYNQGILEYVKLFRKIWAICAAWSCSCYCCFGMVGRHKRWQKVL